MSQRTASHSMESFYLFDSFSITIDTNNMGDGFSKTNGDKTVRFNVGGTIYDVSRSLLDLYPDTMLARMTSSTWYPKGYDDGSEGDRSNESNQNEDEYGKGKAVVEEMTSDDEEEKGEERNSNEDRKRKAPALFIERDCKRFRYCLDYMRNNGLVSLPADVSKRALLRDLEYYGFEDVDPQKISVDPSMPMVEVATKYTNSILNEWRLELEKRSRETKEASRRREKARRRHVEANAREQMFFLAIHCLEEYKDTNDTTISFERHVDPFFHLAEMACDVEHARKRFNECFESIGWEVECERWRSNIIISFSA